MKKISSVIGSLILLCVGISCSSDKDAELPLIYVEQARYSLATGSLEIQATAEQAPTQQVVVDIALAGTAQEGIDFQIDQAAFVFEPGQTQASLKLERIPEHITEESKELIVNLRNEPAGYQLGLMNYTVVELLGSQGIIMSFENRQEILSLASEFNLKLETMQGIGYKVAADTQFEVVVDPSSTAVEGEHFEFVEGPYINVPTRQSQGSLALRFLKREEGKDKLILRLAHKDGYALGNNSQLQVSVKGPSILAGQWQFVAVSNLQTLEEGYGLMTDISKLPKGSTSDYLEFVGDSYTAYTFQPHLSSDLKNYFGTASREIRFTAEVSKPFYEGAVMRPPLIRVSAYQFPDINVNFSATHTKLRDAEVCFRIIELQGEEILECTVEDFEPTDFLSEIYDFMGNMEYTPLRLHFKRK